MKYDIHAIIEGNFVSSFVVMKEITDSLKYKQDEAL